MMVLSSFDPTPGKQHSSRTGGRLRSASDLEDLGIIEPHEKGIIKELISNGDERLQEALDKFEEGDSNELENLMSNGLLSKKTSIDLLEDLDFHFLQQAGLEQLESSQDPAQLATPLQPTSAATPFSSVNGLGSLPPVPSTGFLSTGSALSAALNSGIGGASGGGGGGGGDGWGRKTHDLTLDDISFDGSFDDGCERRVRSDSVSSVNSMSGFRVNGSNISPSMLGQNFPDVFDDMNENRLSAGSNGRPNTRPSSRRNVLTISTSTLTCTTSSSSAPIDIPSRSKGRGNSIAALVDAGMMADRMTEFESLDALQEDDMSDSVGGPHYVGAYSPESRRRRVARFMEKRGRRIWTKKVKYDVRKNFADSRMRVKGRFVRKEDEELLRDLLSLT
eukprot:CAMPEP_0114358956 /NCGR_PEP_ID=MMETSP0101-20121206/22654_1 /TAXON_ID=38822 ORGANISM="Pteridomonas danica, Strain PT" /NCGR_SAMPLE_ID=MMETSP0101 /ASSEMBLY_ACC=CAM_ASM_000211 /LENGTH=390 /DNA_ID=CAMNT_0001502255 /DNA_START=229 /DNA_END=1401 /DNA_ORIENTATION=-